MMVRFIFKTMEVMREGFREAVLRLRRRFPCVVLGGGMLGESHLSEGFWIERGLLTEHMAKVEGWAGRSG